MKFILNKFLKKLSNLLSNTDSVKPHLEKLNGQVVELNVEGAGLSFKISIANENIMTVDEEVPSTLVIQGSIQDLASLIYYARRRESIPAGCVEISGDLSAMQALQDLISNAENGFKEVLAQALGPVVAHRLIRTYEKVANAAAKKSDGVVAQVKDYLLYEKNLMPSNLDILNLERGIYELLDGVDSIEARLNRILDSLKPDD